MNTHDCIDIRRPFATMAALLLLAAPGCKPDEEEPQDSYMFAAEEVSAYTQIDRSAMPAVNVALVMDKESYNLADPSADAAGDFVAQITASLDSIHAALDDDLTGLGLTPCATEVCVGQAAPFVFPDTIKIDLSMDSGFPNGRRLTDPVMDITLALILLDLSVDPQTVTSLVGVLNPTANDLPFDTAFPYVAAPHSP